MRWRSWIVRYGFEGGFRSNGGVAGGVGSGHGVDAVSTRLSMRLGVGNGRRERICVVTGFRSIVVDASGGVGGGVNGAIAAGVAGGLGGFLACSGGVTGLDIENFVVVFGEVGGVVGVEVLLLSPSLLKLRPEALTTSLSTGLVWCWRTCS